jgi:Protein of unknown function (DUF2799)
MKPFAYVALLSLPLLSACASLTPEQCETGDWLNLGISDGAQGRPLARLDEHREACGKVGISIDTETYIRGRDQGLTRYCTPVSGFTVGRNGRSHANVCPAELAGGFEAGYVLGSELNTARSALADAEKSQRNAENRLNEITAQIATLRSAIVNEQDREKRKALNNEVGRLNNVADRQRHELRRLERQRRDRAGHLDIVREDAYARLRTLAPGWSPQ